MKRADTSLRSYMGVTLPPLLRVFLLIHTPLLSLTSTGAGEALTERRQLSLGTSQTELRLWRRFGMHAMIFFFFIEV